MSPTGLTTRPIIEQFEHLAAINDDLAGGGVTREVFTPSYERAVAYVSGLMHDAGLAVRVDTFGNLIGRLDGADETAPIVMTGSHIDTTLNAGAYDGVLGVIGAVEAIRALRDTGWQPTRGVEVVSFAGEEPRFGSGCIGSRAMTGSLTAADLTTMRDRAGVSIAEAMRDVRLDPARLDEARIALDRVLAFVELHIEQGGVLEAAGISIGAVTHIAAPHDLTVRIQGVAAHAGATPMHLRQDAFAGAAELAVALERLARESPRGSTVATVGVVEVAPGAINVIPDLTAFQVDIRDHDLAARTAVVDAFVSLVGEVAARRDLDITVDTITRDQPAACSELVIDAVRSGSEAIGEPCIDLVSGAYHDAMVIGAHIPMGMIFVPSVGGISHSPLEFTSADDIDRGIRALAETLRRLAETP